MTKLLTTLLLFLTSLSYAQQTQLEKEFLRPPRSVQTTVYWYWMSGNISREGVLKDLEAMKKVGINRAFIGNIYFEPYEGGRNVKLMSEEWWDITHAALKRAAELDIEIGMFNSPGWTQAGGPWVKDEEAMRYLASSELKVTGPIKLSTPLKKPTKFFQDVKVIAYPAPKSDGLILTKANAKISVSPGQENEEEMFDGNRVGGMKLPKDKQVYVTIAADSIFTARSLTIYPSHTSINAEFEFQAKIGNDFKTISKFEVDWHHLALIVGFQPYAPVAISFPETRAEEFRLVARNRLDEGGIAEIEVSASPRIENYPAKTFAKMSQDPLPKWDYYMWRSQPEPDSEEVIDPSKVIDISRYLTESGTLTWEVPEGDWIIIRTGMTPTGVINNPGGPDGTGLEVDKMSKAHLSKHFDAFIGKILKRIPPEDRKTFKVVVQDSYESGGQNFTEGFLESFEERYGYDPMPLLPAYFGKVVGSQQTSDRFLWDLRRFVADKVAYDYVGGFRELCHKYGLRAWLENYGHWGFPSEFLMYGGQADEVSGEYWLPSAGASWENDLGNIENRAASSSAHIYGKNLVSSESNTSGGPAFSRVPADAKQRTDKYFAEGINNTLLHVYIHQPDIDKFPGTNAWFGTEFNRTNTWFSHIDLFLDYIKRCNYMLRQGLNIADVAYFIGEDVPKMTGSQDPSLPVGYQFDYINAEVLLRDATVKNGLITLPHGTSYKVLVLPKIATMRPELLLKIKKMVADGAVVLGPRPKYSPSLQNQPLADKQLNNLARELWRKVDIMKPGISKFGKGLISEGADLDDLFAKINLVPDCKIPADVPIHFGHRKMDNTDIYFLTNQSGERQSATIAFRVQGLQPELWNPIDGSVRKLKEFSINKKTVDVPLVLEPYESAFVVFRNASKPIRGVKNFPPFNDMGNVGLRWNVSFSSPLSNLQPITLNKLVDLSKSENDSIKYFSGHMLYTATFKADSVMSTKRRIYLDLGQVKHLAKIWLNDKYIGGTWTPPYRVDISDAVINGTNSLRIEVVNTWVNRLIGDRIVPEHERKTWAGINPYSSDSALQPSGLLGPVRLLYRLEK